LPWQSVKSTNWRFFGPNYFVALPFRNGFKYRNSDSKRWNTMNFSTLCTILVTFGLETPEFTLLTIAPFAAIRQKSAYHVKYLRISWTYLDLVYRFGRCISGDDYANDHLSVAQGTLRWQLVTFREWLQTSPGTTLLLALAFNNGLADRKSAFKRLNGNVRATSCPNLVNFRPTISEFSLLKRSTLPRFATIWRRSAFITSSFQNGLEDHNYDFRRVFGSQLLRSLRHKNVYSRRQIFLQWLQVRSVGGGAARQGGDQ